MHLSYLEDASWLQTWSPFETTILKAMSLQVCSTQWSSNDANANDAFYCVCVNLNLAWSAQSREVSASIHVCVRYVILSLTLVIMCLYDILLYDIFIPPSPCVPCMLLSGCLALFCVLLKPENHFL